ncbi:AraC-type DNA-binding protein [Marivirga sericea]|uniref:AraC-type DNA-binding protein n=1 Tax=Marivirga sericea TaxID=1028 RepID=A0A1X7LCU6_9BACT|nr:helix-turn-helix domain-containing protein [Marivirga sericea]SMG51686.1 AraC-type DNA-binding protein [Marivirga sericea]
MKETNLLIFIPGIALFITLLLALFLIIAKTKHKISNRLFALFLTLIGIDIGGVFIDFIGENPSNLGMLNNSITFLQLPVFYLYVLSVCYSDFSLKLKHLFHIIPFLVVNLILLPNYYLVDTVSKISFFENNLNGVELKFNYTLLHIQIVAYMIAIFMILKKTKKLYLENNAGSSINSYNWLLQFTIALTIFYCIALFKNIFKLSDYTNISEWIKIGLFLFEILIICWYLFKALNNPNVFRNVNSRLKPVADIVSERQKSNHFDKVENNYEETLLLLNEYMKTEKPYLNPSITIQYISDEIQIPVRDLSLLINHKLGQHFFDFINAYRIENAMRILKDPEKSKMNILEILYEVGFNSKSSFNTAFKKHTGITPTSYRNQF